MKRMQVRHILGAVGVLTLLASSAGVARAGGGGGANDNAFKVAAAGIGFDFKFSQTGALNTFTNMAKNNQTFDVSQWLSAGGKGYYEIGFNIGAPPAYVMILDSGSKLGSVGQIVKITKIGAVFLYDPGTFVPGTISNPVTYPVANGVELYSYKTNGPGVTDVTSTSPLWQADALDSTKTYFGYDDETQSGNGGLFCTGTNNTADALSGAPYPNYGVFNFSRWSASSASNHVYIGLDVQTANGNTGRIYIDHYSNLIPEPAFYQMAALLGLGAGGFALRFRSRRAA